MKTATVEFRPIFLVMILNSNNVHRFVPQSDARLSIARLTLQLTTIKYILWRFHLQLKTKRRHC